MAREKLVTPQKVSDAIASLDKPFASTTDIADVLNVSVQAVRNHSEELEESYLLKKGKVDRQTVYWLSDNATGDKSTKRRWSEDKIRDIVREETGISGYVTHE